MDELILRRCTGSPAAMALKLDISQTTLFAYLSIMKRLGAPIRYNKYKKTYYYEEDGCFKLGFCYSATKEEPADPP
jgi:hypothetical protein